MYVFVKFGKCGLSYVCKQALKKIYFYEHENVWFPYSYEINKKKKNSIMHSRSVLGKPLITFLCSCSIIVASHLYGKYLSLHFR